MSRAKAIWVILALIAGVILCVTQLMLMPKAHASPGDCDYSVGYCGHQWNGPVQRTWDTPGYYGGENTGPELCSPFTYGCEGVAPGN